MITDCGELNDPIKFFPCELFIPVLPPIAASTIPASEVGIAYQVIPRSQVAATKPARSVVEPPPMPTIASLRVKPKFAHASHISSKYSGDLAASPLGVATTWTELDLKDSRSKLVTSSLGAITITFACESAISEKLFFQSSTKVTS